MIAKITAEKYFSQIFPAAPLVEIFRGSAAYEILWDNLKVGG